MFFLSSIFSSSAGKIGKTPVILTTTRKLTARQLRRENRLKHATRPCTNCTNNFTDNNLNNDLCKICNIAKECDVCNTFYC